MTVKTNQEIERRFLVTSIDPDIRRFPSRRIQQGYFETPPYFSLRVRISDDVKAEITRKDGIGIQRTEATLPTDLATAEFLLASCTDVLDKARYLRDGWEVDFYEGPLAGLVIAEFESPDAAEAELPPWIQAAREVTDTVSNRVLARLATSLVALSDDRPRQAARLADFIGRL
jgi:CYTH domain-containing protein